MCHSMKHTLCAYNPQTHWCWKTWRAQDQEWAGLSVLPRCRRRVTNDKHNICNELLEAVGYLRNGSMIYVILYHLCICIFSVVSVCIFRLTEFWIITKESFALLMYMSLCHSAPRYLNRNFIVNRWWSVSIEKYWWTWYTHSLAPVGWVWPVLWYNRCLYWVLL